eukprot:COSAG05_NODE_946_length_6457_cov_4.475243_2_plen_154_part_00
MIALRDESDLFSTSIQSIGHGGSAPPHSKVLSHPALLAAHMDGVAEGGEGQQLGPVASSVSFGDLLEQFANTEEDPAAVALAIGPGGGSSKGKGGSDSAFRPAFVCPRAECSHALASGLSHCSPRLSTKVFLQPPARVLESSRARICMDACSY